MLLEKLSEDLKIEVSKEEIENAMNDEAQRMGVNKKTIKNMYKGERKLELEYRLRSEKTLDIVLEKANIEPDEKALNEKADS